MKKYVLYFLLFLSGISQLSAQADRFIPKMGFMYEFFTLMPEDTTYQQIIANSQNGSSQIFVPYYTFMVGTYYMLAHKNDVVSVGVDGAIQGGINFTGGGISYQAQVPLFLMGRLGAGATSYNQQKIGLGLGLGAQTSYLNEKRPFVYNSEGPKKIFGFIPSAIIEATIQQGGGHLTGRIHFPLMMQRTKIAQLNNPIANSDYWKVGNFGFGLIYGF